VSLALLVGGALVLFAGSTTPLWGASAGVDAGVGKIAFARDGIYVVNTDGSGVKRLRVASRFRGVSWDNPAWAPEGKRLALLGTFYNDTLDKDHRIYVRSPSGRAKDITSVGSGTAGIAWSPSGKWLAIGTGLEAWRLAVVNVSSGKSRLVTRYYGDDLPGHLTASGSTSFTVLGRSAMASHAGRRATKRTWSQKGGGRVRARLVPDSKKISFARFNANGDGLGIWVIDADGFHPGRLRACAGDGEPAWSPIGSQIVFTRSGGDFGSTSGSCDRTGVTRPA
jgi:Tol biopolymer transport system component